MNRTRLTPKKKERFCKELVLTGGHVTKAAQAVGISRVTCYDHRDPESPRYDPDFEIAWNAAVEEGTENLEKEAYRRAHDGVDEPHFYKDKVAGYVRKYSDVLLMFLLKARKRNVYDAPQRQELSGKDGGPIQTEEVSPARNKLEHQLARRFTVTRPKGMVGGDNGS